MLKARATSAAAAASALCITGQSVLSGRFILVVVEATEQDERYKAAKARVQQLRAFYTHLATYVVINLFLIVLNLITSPDSLWFYWVTLGWGIGLVLHGVQVFGTGSIF